MIYLFGERQTESEYHKTLNEHKKKGEIERLTTNYDHFVLRGGGE